MMYGDIRWIADLVDTGKSTVDQAREIANAETIEILYEDTHILVFECTDNGGGHQTFEVRATDKQEAIKKGMAFAKKHASGDICSDWECKLKLEDLL